MIERERERERERELVFDCWRRDKKKKKREGLK